MVEMAIGNKHDESIQGQAFSAPQLNVSPLSKKFYIESYGCQMNFADSEVVASILMDKGFGVTQNFEEADLIFLNTCSIRKSRVNSS